MQRSLSVIHVGVPVDHPIVPESERPALSRRLAELRSAMLERGVTYELATHPPDAELAPFVERLEARRWDAVIIGAGVVRTASLAHFMERIVDATRIAAPQAKLLFIHGVEDVEPALDRWFGRSIP